MLSIIGLGIFDENDISLRGLEEIRRSDKAYVEFYTNIWHGDVAKLEKTVGKKIIALKRRDIEDNNRIISDAKAKNVCLLVPGDPLAATTHAELLLRAKNEGIETKIIHSSSIFSSVGECGLQLYKFGRTATIPLPEKTGGVAPESVYDIVKGNLKLGAHTLLLLDIDVENKKALSVKEGLETLKKLDKKKILGKFVVISMLGSEKQRIDYGDYGKLSKINYELPAVIVVPGKLHFAEEEFINAVAFK
ncbi:MAG: diphthine synthase [Candidatus Aenigmatarchaeota archaeon]